MNAFQTGSVNYVSGFLGVIGCAHKTHIPIKVNEGDFVKGKSFYGINVQVKTEQVFLWKDSLHSISSLQLITMTTPLHSQDNVMELSSSRLLEASGQAPVHIFIVHLH